MRRLTNCFCRRPRPDSLRFWLSEKQIDSMAPGPLSGGLLFAGNTNLQAAIKCIFVVAIFLSVPGATANAQDSAAVPPKLKFTVILTRHGVRSPTWNLADLNQ